MRTNHKYNMEGKILEKDLCYKLVGCLYKVRNLYGSGHRENFYDKILNEVLLAENLAFVDKPRIPLFSLQTGKIVSYIIPDKLIADKIILEIKAKPFSTTQDIAQVREYLRITPYEILYLVNFGEQNFNPIRSIYTNDRKPFLTINS